MGERFSHFENKRLLLMHGLLGFLTMLGLGLGWPALANKKQEFCLKNFIFNKIST